MVVELTPEAVAQIQRWLVLLAGDITAPAWDPVENYETPESVRAAAQWLVDNGHGCGMDDQLVAVLLVLFSMNLRWKVEAEIEVRFISPGADHVWTIDLDRLARECALAARSPSAEELTAGEKPSPSAPGSRCPLVLAEDEHAAKDVQGQERMPSDHRG
jgi:hypothetical protein